MCFSVDNDEADGVNPVWCFLENIRDPGNPISGCYPDTTWSPKDGRFWSAEACNGLPPLDIDDLSLAVGEFLMSHVNQMSSLKKML